MIPKKISVKAILGDGSESTKDITLLYSGKRLGRGTFGCVYKVELEETGEEAAVKTSHVTETGETDEVNYLAELKHCNIVDMLYYFRNGDEWDTTEYIVMECMPTTLFGLYKKNRELTQFDIKLYIYQVLRALAFMHHKDICHRDIKPENVLLNPYTGVVKLCDFGSTASLSSDYNSIRVGSPTYRAPEMILGFVNYTKTIDLWATGCVLFELLKGGSRLFYMSRTPIINQIVEYFGTPTKSHFPGLTCHPKNDQLDKLPKKKAKSWPEIVSPYSIPEDAVSLCSQLLCYTPTSRILPQHALAHKFFDDLRSPDLIYLTNGNLLPPLFHFQPDEFHGDFDILIPSFIKKEQSDESDPFFNESSDDEKNPCCSIS